MQLLVIEDNKRLSAHMKKALENNGFNVDCAFDGQTGEDMASSNDYDLIILDILLPAKDGLDVCRSLRKDKIKTPILILSAKADIEDRISGLDFGADDYLTKPFELTELLARVRAMLRRRADIFIDTINLRDVVIDCSARTVKKAGVELALTAKEFTILEYLARNKNIALSRNQILDHCWDHSYESYSNDVDVYIRRIRRKLNDSDLSYIKTVRGIGYKA